MGIGLEERVFRKTLEIGGHFLVPFIVRLTQTDKRRCDILIEYEAWDTCGLVDSREWIVSRIDDKMPSVLSKEAEVTDRFSI